MFNLDALDKLIAVVVVLLVLSLIVQSIQAAIKKIFHIKSLQLEQSLVHLFYYLLDKDSIKAMRSVSDRMPLLRAFFRAPIIRKFLPDHARSPSARDPHVEALYQAVSEEFLRAGRVSARGRMLIESISKDELIKFIGQVRVRDLIKHLKLPEPENISGIRDEIAGARKAVKQLSAKHHALLEKTPLAEIREPLLELLSNSHQCLDLKNSDLTLGDLSDAGERCTKIALHVHRERFERRHVQHAAAASLRRLRREHQAIETPQERGQRFAAAGRREDQRRLAACDRRPAERLRRCRFLEGGGEPGTHRRMKRRKRIRGRACHEVIL